MGKEKGAARESATVATVEGTPAEEATPAPVTQSETPAAAASPAPAEQPEAASDPHGALLQAVGLYLAAGGAAGVQVTLISVDAEGNGGLLRLEAHDRATTRSASGLLLHSGDGREWTYLGDGPSGEEFDRAASYVHVSPLA